MPRYFMSRTDDGTEFKTASDAGGGSKAEKFLLGNTDFEGQANPLTNFNFVLEVEALYFLALKSVKAFNKENEFEYIREGGVNDYVHLKRKPISKPFTFQVERYVGTDRFLDPLALGTELVLPLALYVYRHKAQQGWSSGAWSDKMPGRIFLFTGCTVMSKDYGELDAERSGLLTETTTISYRELIAITNPFDNSEKPEWEFKKDSDGIYKTKYAAFANNDKTKSGTYPFEFTTDEFGNRITKRKSSDKEHKDAWTGKDGSKPRWAKQSGPDQTDATYKVETKDGVQTVSRVDSSQFNRAQYELAKDGSDLKYAKQSPIDANPGEKIYDDVPDKDGTSHKKRVDHSQVNKPAWDGSKGAKPSYAKESAPDMAGTTYAVSTKDGVSTVKRKDSSDYNRPQYELKKDKSKQKYSEVAFVDRNAAEPIYSVKNGIVTRTDHSEVNKPQYELHKDRENVKYALRPADDDKRAEPVIWPPTRRAMMADMLKK